MERLIIKQLIQWKNKANKYSTIRGVTHNS